MKAKYDFSKGRRGAVLPSSGNKVRITIRLDRDVIDWFRSKVEEADAEQHRRFFPSIGGRAVQFSVGLNTNHEKAN